MSHSLTEAIMSLYKAKGTSRGNESLTLVEYSDLVELNDCPEGGTVVHQVSRVAYGAAPIVGPFRLWEVSPRKMMNFMLFQRHPKKKQNQRRFHLPKFSPRQLSQNAFMESIVIVIYLRQY